MATTPMPDPDITFDGTGLLCVTLVLRLRKRIGGDAPRTVVHVIATGPAAPLDLPASCHPVGHAYLGVVDRADRPAHASGSPPTLWAPDPMRRGALSTDRFPLATAA
ncbi:sulfurtransferase TusA family protein [Streptomyces sp. IMTB 2501]|uniref:sulfurtransferase TusA family protein n=1 Tax=Streptomyces sp. IMTB 2501 TaxID=1776340 RepID=UPI00211672E0|nr:sulfurtransferase TusA family protein [Streptomyces sp. IMTB 2501]